MVLFYGMFRQGFFFFFFFYVTRITIAHKLRWTKIALSSVIRQYTCCVHRMNYAFSQVAARLICLATRSLVILLCARHVAVGNKLAHAERESTSARPLLWIIAPLSLPLYLDGPHDCVWFGNCYWPPQLTGLYSRVRVVNQSGWK